MGDEHDFGFSNLSNPNQYHSADVSHRWPPMHAIMASEDWEELHDHRADTTRSWPGNHQPSNSFARPTHDGEFSESVPVPSDHIDLISTRGPDDRGGYVSNAHPPNHLYSTTLSWPTSHRLANSFYWPANHSSGPSSSWPPHIDTNWPADHWEEASSEDSQPTGTPFFPEDHSYWTTVQDVPGLIPR